MLTCKHCHLFRFWLKVAVSATILILGWQISSHISALEIKSVYQEPLSKEQQEWKDFYLKDRTLPEVLTTKDGTKLYYDSESGTATATKPNWLNDSGQIVLTRSEKEHIARFNVVNTTLLGIELKSISVADYGTLTGGVSMLYLLGGLAGIIITLAKERGEKLGYVKPLLMAIAFCSFYFLVKEEIFLTLLLGTVYGLINGLLLWPLLLVVEKITETPDPHGTPT